MRKPYPKNRKRRPITDRFESKFVSPSHDECWNWLASKTPSGYGIFFDGTRNIPAHRFSYMAYIGTIPDGHDVCHKCDNPACVNPSHLWVGTRSANMLDCEYKGRRTRRPSHGEKNPQAKLTDEAVRHIRKREMTQMQYAALYGVSQSCIWNALHGAGWKHVI